MKKMISFFLCGILLIPCFSCGKAVEKQQFLPVAERPPTQMTDRIYTTFEETLENSSDVVKAVYKGRTIGEFCEELTFSVKKTYKGIADGEIIIRVYPEVTGVFDTDIYYQSGLLSYQKGEEYFLVLCRFEKRFTQEFYYLIYCEAYLPVSDPAACSIYYEPLEKHSQLRLSEDGEAACFLDQEEAVEMEDYLVKIVGENRDRLEDVVYTYTTSDDPWEMLSYATAVIRVKITGGPVDKPHAGISSYTCAIREVLYCPEELELWQKISTTSPLGLLKKDQEYILIVGGDSANSRHMVSPHAAFPVEDRETLVDLIARWEEQASQ